MYQDVFAPDKQLYQRSRKIIINNLLYGKHGKLLRTIGIYSSADLFVEFYVCKILHCTQNMNIHFCVLQTVRTLETV